VPLIFSVKKSNVPESVPGPKSLSGTFGNPERTSLQLSTFEPVSQIFFSSATVRQFAHVFDLFATIEIPSFATVIASQRTPLSRHFLCSEALIGRDAFERSVSLLQKRSKPPPVPEMPTVTCTPLFFFWNISAAAVVSGPTVLEPSAVILPLSFARPADPAAVTAAAVRTPTKASTPTRLARLNRFIPPLSIPVRSHRASERLGGGQRAGERLVSRW
jgi:hypothetical protein